MEKRNELMSRCPVRRGPLAIDESAIWRQLDRAERPLDDKAFDDILTKAQGLAGLTAQEAAQLICLSDPQRIQRMFNSARQVKEQIYGRRLVVFAPLYISNHCSNECAYCAFRCRNHTLQRTTLDPQQIENETEALIEQGHKRILLVAGESERERDLSYILSAIDGIYGVKRKKSGIRRINVNIAPLSQRQFARLRQHRIGTYQIFQETYHHETYCRVHLKGRKTDFHWRLEAPDRAMEAGIDDVGIGALFGLFDWRFEVLALLQHIAHLERRFGVGPHTISVPRLEPAGGSLLSAAPPHPVSDDQFRKLVAVLRLAVPYTGIIMSTRETAQMRTATFALGVSQISAGSRTDPGGYNSPVAQSGQFSLGDHRPLDEVVRDVAEQGYLPSFCTGCYRLGRTGADFMDLARPGAIRNHCDPNGISTFAEYLSDFGSPETRRVGRQCIDRALREMAPRPRATANRLIKQVAQGCRDVYC